MKKQISAESLDLIINELNNTFKKNIILKNFSFTEMLIKLDLNELVENLHFLQSQRVLKINSLIITGSEYSEIINSPSFISISFYDVEVKVRLNFIGKNDKIENSSMQAISFTECLFRVQQSFFQIESNVLISNCDFRFKSIEFHNMEYSIEIHDSKKIDEVNFFNTLTPFTLINKSEVKSLKLTNYKNNDDTNLELNESIINMIDIRTTNKGIINIQDCTISRCFAFVPNSLIQANNIKHLFSIEIDCASEIKISQIRGVEHLAISNINHDSFVDLVNIQFSGNNPSLEFERSILKNCFLRSIDLSNVKVVFSDSTSHEIQPFSLNWEKAKSIETNSSEIDFFRDLKNYYLKANDSYYSHYFFQIERNILLNENVLNLLNGKNTLTNLLILYFNKLTGNGFSFFKPLLVITICTLYIHAINSNDLSDIEELSHWLIPFKEINEHTNNIWEFSIYLILSLLNTSCLFQAIQGFRKFNKRF
ncbi:hypothetical protein ACRXCV_04985 [Halobacteriovorax sp. GFR7]|uniref:hypothetical protein n=1 Tax=unclassified Halobacteriovorax TaxID=2639665 RepID=UPI003D985451